MWSGGRGVVAATKVDGRQFLKLTLLNPKASVQDVLDIIEQVRTLGRAVPEVAR